MTSYSLGLPALWPDDSIGMDSPPLGDPAVFFGTGNLTLLVKALSTVAVGLPPSASGSALELGAAILADMANGFGGSLLAVGVDSGWYQAVLVVHLASAVVGFGGSAVGTVMLRRAWGEGPATAAAVRRSIEFASIRVVEVAAYLAGIAGVVAVIIGPWNFRQDWVTLAFVLYFAWLAIAHGALRPAGARLAAALEAPALEATASNDPSDASGDIQRLRRRIELWSTLSNLVIVAAIVVMVIKPSW